MLTNMQQTSLSAYREIQSSGKLGTQQQLILERIRASNAKYGEHDFSLQEIAAITKLPINAVSGRVNDLKKAGMLVESNKRACKVTGRTIVAVRLGGVH